MPIYEITTAQITPIVESNFSDLGLRERADLQRLLKKQIDVIAPNTLVIAEEFGEWDESRRRIDLLGIDTDANIVVIELKRTNDGGHMELQALRYAAMVANMTFERAVQVFGRYLETEGDEPESAEQLMLDFLGWDEADEDSFAQDVKIVLASAEFSKELTSAVLWLNEKDLDIRCVRMKPYKDGERTLLDVQTVIPLPEAETYQIQIKEKKQKEKVQRAQNRDLTRYDLIIENGSVFTNLPKRQVVYRLFAKLIETGLTPEEACEFTGKPFNTAVKMFDGKLVETALSDALQNSDVSSRRFFCKAGEPFYVDGKTYVLTKMWGINSLSRLNENLMASQPFRYSLEPTGG